MKLDPVRLKKQEAFVELWRSNKGRGTLEASTGFGKTYTAILIIQKLRAKNPSATVLVSVPSNTLKDQWNAELKTFGLKADVTVINSIIKRDLSYDLLILDEIHNTGAATFSKIFQKVKYRYVLGLTATMDRMDGNEVMIKQKCPVLLTVSMKEAERSKFISRFNLFNYGITLEGSELNYLNKLNAEVDKLFNFFEGNYSLIDTILKGGNIGVNINGTYTTVERGAMSTKAVFHFAKAKGIDPSIVIGMAANYMKAIGQRKRYLYDHPKKLVVAQQIIKKFGSRKIITFSQSVAFAKKLNSLTTDSFFYDAKTKAYNQKRLEDYRQGHYNIIHSVKALDEGFNVKSLDMAIHIAGTSQPRQFIQRVGRVVRQQEGKTAIVVDIYIKGSQEEKWLRNRQSKSKKAIEISSVEEITEQVNIFETSNNNYDGLFEP